MGNYNLGQVYRLRFDVDMVAGAWKVFLDETEIYSGPFTNTFDVRDIRIHFSDSSGGDGLAAVDNIKIWAFESGSLIDPLVPDISVAPANVQFGPVAQNTAATKLVRIDNLGEDDLILTTMYINRPELSLVGVAGAFPMTIAPDQSRDIAVRYTPVSGDAMSGHLAIRSNDPDESFKVIPLSGTGVVGQKIGVSTQSVNVSLDPGQSTTATLTLQNSGTGALNWSLASQGGSTPSSGSPIPDDPDFSLLWGLRNPSEFGAGIAATDAWSITTGSEQVVVGVIDTGVEWDHPDLAANIWSNADEIAGNDIDDDNNGFIDDVRGWDFFGNDANPMDSGGHGTHVAGTIAARGDNGIGVTGVAWNAKIMPIRFLGPAGGTTADAIESIDYATLNGAHLTNNSWGGGAPTVLLANAISRSQAQDMLFVAAAGNSALNADVRPMYPAAYPNSNIVSVAATDRYDQLAYFSNYGATSVDLAAPGRSIYSSFLRDDYRILSGTSMASPHVAGAVALLLAQDSSRTFYQTKQLLLNHVDTIPSLNGKVRSDGRLNIFSSLGGSGTPRGSWLTLGTDSGTLGGNSQQVVQLTFDAADLAPGSFTDILTLTTNDPVRPTIDIQVALDVAGSGTTSTGPEITAQAESVSTTAGSDATFSVSASGSGSGTLSYQWFIGPVGDTSQPVGGDSPTLTLSGVTSTTEVWVRVSEGLSSTFSEGAFASVAPDHPHPVVASDSLFTDKVRVKWLAVADAASYEVSRLPNPNDQGEPETILGSTAGVVFNDTTAVAGQNYTYLVRGISSGGERGLAAGDSGIRATLAMDGTLLPITNRVDLVYAYDGAFLAVTSTAGSVDFYDTGLHQITRSVSFEEKVAGIDAAVDSYVVLVARPDKFGSTQSRVTKIEFSTPSVDVNSYDFTINAEEQGSYDVAYLADDLALVSTFSVDEILLRTLNPSTGVFTIRAGSLGDHRWQAHFLDRTPDGVEGG